MFRVFAVDDWPYTVDILGVLMYMMKGRDRRTPHRGGREAPDVFERTRSLTSYVAGMHGPAVAVDARGPGNIEMRPVAIPDAHSALECHAVSHGRRQVVESLHPDELIMRETAHGKSVEGYQRARFGGASLDAGCSRCIFVSGIEARS